MQGEGAAVGVLKYLLHVSALSIVYDVTNASSVRISRARKTQVSNKVIMAVIRGLITLMSDTSAH